MQWIPRVSARFAGAEEQGDLHDPLVDEVGENGDRRDGSRDGHPQGDVGKLADRGVCQPSLELILGQGPQGAVHDGHGGQGREGTEHAEPGGEVDAVDVVDDPHDPKAPAFTTATA
jgi:hypothetical protein